MKFQELQTKRLRLRTLTLEDAKDIMFLRSDKRVNEFIDRKAPKKIEEVLAFIETIIVNNRNKKSCYWCISEKNHTKAIGTICLWNFSEDKKTAEVGYELHPKYQGKGMMSEALNAVLEFGFHELKLESIEAFTHKENNNSVKLLLKNQFMHDVLKQDKNNENNVIFELKKDRILL